MRNMFSLEAERGVIGAILIDNSLAETIGAELDRKHFYDADLGHLYQLCLSAKSQGKQVDVITLSDQCESLPSGANTLSVAAQVQVSVPSAANALVYAGIVKERHLARELERLGKDIIELATTKGDIATQVARAQELAMMLDADFEGRDVYQLVDGINEVLDDMQDVMEGRDTGEVTTGLSDIDKLTKGYRRGTLNIVAGRPGSGKSLIASMIAQSCSLDTEDGTLIFTLEMSKKELAKRMLAAVADVDQGSIDSADALGDPDSVTRISAAVNRISHADIRVCDRANLEFSKLLSIARYQHRARPLRAIVVDYIGLIASSQTGKYQNRNLELGQFSRGLKQLAKELDIPVIALAQLNRGIEGRVDAMPKMSDLRDSGEIEQDADTIMICHRRDDEHGRAGVTLVEAVKVRHGSVGGTAIQMQGSKARFVQLANAHQEYEASLQPNRKSKHDPFA